LLPATLNCHTGFVFKWNCIRLLWYLRRCNITSKHYNVTFYIHCLSFLSTTNKKKNFPALLDDWIQESYPVCTATELWSWAMNWAVTPLYHTS
jgi:hypothetical protein